LVYYGASGYRGVAADYVGYGLSDKPISRRYHTLRRHVDHLAEFLTHLGPRPMTLIMEDWGGPLGLSYAIQHPDRVRRLVIINSWAFQDTYINRLDPLVKWVTRRGVGDLLFGTLNLALNGLVQRWTARPLSEAVLTAYKVPFRDPRHRAALVQFPRLISTLPDHPSAAVFRQIESQLHTLRPIPTLILWGRDNPVFAPDVAAHWKKMIPRAKGPFLIEPARHLLAEDAPDVLIRHLNSFFEKT
jgi:haloalkane dehalogenase